MEATQKAQQELEQIERQVALIEATAGQNEETHRQLAKLQERVHTLRQEMKALQTAWQKTELARHPQRPQTLDYIERVFTDWSEIHGDRGFGDDPAIVCGMARFHGEEVLVVGTQKGRDMKQRVYRNFGTPHPGGLSQGAARDAGRGEVSQADFHAGGYGRRLPWNSRGGARAGRGDCLQLARNGAAAKCPSSRR